MADEVSRTSRPPTVSYDPMAQRAAGQSLSGLTDDEARDFHRTFMVSFVVFTAIAAVAHWLVWQWRPWIPGTQGYEVVTAVADTAVMVAQSIR